MNEQKKQKGEGFFKWNTKKNKIKQDKEKQEEEKRAKEKQEAEDLLIWNAKKNKAKQDKEKQQEQDLLKWNTKKKKIKQDKENKKKLQQQQLLTPKIKNNLLCWVDKNKNGSVYEGIFGKEKCFEIRRGISVFSLKAIHKEIKHCNSANCIDLYKLQKKANEILCLNSEFLLKFKPIS